MSDVPERLRFRILPIEYYVSLLHNHTPFAITRWSDGDWPCVLGHKGRNTDKHDYSAKLRRDLTEVLLSRPTYTMAIQPFLTRQPKLANEVNDWMVEHDLRFDWVTGDTFCHALIRDEFDRFITMLRQRTVILVGPQRLRPLTLFPVSQYVEVPLLNCHEECERVTDQTSQAIDELGVEPVVSISAGMSANVIVDRLHRRHPNATLIDIGSIWEPFVGVTCRRYHADVIKRVGPQ